MVDDMTLEEGMAYVKGAIKEIQNKYTGKTSHHINLSSISSRECRIEAIRKCVVEASNIPITIKKELLITECCKEWGCSRRTALEYLTQLIAEQSIIIDGDDVYSFERWLKIEKAHKLDYLKGKQIINKFF